MVIKHGYYGEVSSEHWLNETE